MSYIIECWTCGQVWDLPTYVLPSRKVWVQVPEHDALTETGVPTGIPCGGVLKSGLSMGSRDTWEAQWALRHPQRPRPQVLDGDQIKLTRV
jgi:hypothetical protein